VQPLIGVVPASFASKNEEYAIHEGWPTLGWKRGPHQRGGCPSEAVEKRGLKVVSDSFVLVAAIDEALAAQADVLEEIRAVELQAAGAAMGAVTKAMRGEADGARARSGARSGR
jgi:hypothetical protein